MRREISYRPLCWLLTAASVLIAVNTLSADETALDRYIAKPDPNYAWKLVSQKAEQGQTTFVIALTSQKWRSADDVDKPLWTHQLTVVRPDKARPGTAFLFIGGGSLQDEPKPASPRNTALAVGPIPSSPSSASCPTNLCRLPTLPISVVRKMT